MNRESTFNQLTQMLKARYWSVAHAQSDDIRLCAAYGIVPDLITGRSTNLEKSVPTHLVRKGEAETRLTVMAQHHALLIASNSQGALRVRCASVVPFEKTSTYVRSDRINNTSVFAYQSSRLSVNTAADLLRTIVGNGQWSLHNLVIYPGKPDEIARATQHFISWTSEQGLRPGDQRVPTLLLEYILG